jgi:hypothetical protein
MNALVDFPWVNGVALSQESLEQGIKNLISDNTTFTESPATNAVLVRPIPLM